MSANIIPIHNFSVDNEETNERFRLIELTTRSDYDSSVAQRQNYYEIFIFEKGGGFHEIDFNRIPIIDRSVHFVSPGQVHKVNREKSSCGYIILFSREFFYLNNQNTNSLFSIPFLNNNYTEPVIDLNEADYNQMITIVNGMKNEYDNNQDHKKSAIQSYLNLLLLSCTRLFDKEKGGGGELHKNNTFQNFRRLLESEFEKNHKVSSYADKLGVTDKQLSVLTKSIVGKTALEMIHNRIILEAKRLLKHSNHSIKEIAFFLNFDDPSHFGKFFKGKENITPKEYRSI